MSGHSVLCVDDEPSILQALKRLLRREPYTVLTATTPEEAFSLLSAHKVQLVISDQRMPAMSGTELLAQVKKLHPDTIRIVLSGYADPTTIAEAVNKGHIYRFLPKPWDDEELKLAIRQCLEQYDLADHNHRLNEQVKLQNEELKRLNEELAQTVTERTYGLNVSQQMLDCLPYPAIGIGREGTVAFTNEALRRTVPALRSIALGDDAYAALPPGPAARAAQCIRGDGDGAEWVERIDGQAIGFQVRSLGGGPEAVGCLLLIHAPEITMVDEKPIREPVAGNKVAKGIVNAIREIPPLPAALQRLCAMAGQPDADVREMARIIATDAALTARILRVANSAFYGLSQRIATVPRAISVLGIHGVRNIALAATLFGFGRGKDISLDMTAFWKHCAAMGTAARQIARLLKLNDTEEAFVGGLLHDIGRVVLASHWREQYAEVLRRARQGGMPLAVVETEVLGTNSAEVGRALCERWRLPEALCAAVACHHDDAVAVEPGAGAGSRMLLAVAGADTLAKLAGIGDSGNPKAFIGLIDVLRVHGISAEQLRRVVIDLPEELRKMEALFDLSAAGLNPAPQQHRPVVALHMHDATAREIVALALLTMGCELAQGFEHAGAAIDSLVVDDGTRAALPESQRSANIPILDYGEWTREAGAMDNGYLDAARLRAWLARAINGDTPPKGGAL